jgi:dGTPase
MTTDDVLSPGYDQADEQRWVAEAPKRAGRTAFARDRARVLHSAALRRLAAKTQVMVAGQQDFPRTRLTHTLEVAQIARELGASLGCDADLVEVAGLAHDLGHPPFGHNGEDALNTAAKDFGGFEGNAQSLRVLSRLEAKSFAPTDHPRHGESVGLNLTRACLDAATKYPWPRREGTVKFGVYSDDVDVFSWLRHEAPDERTCFETQVMDWADDVAYSVHDVEDAIHAGHLDLGVLRDPEHRRQLIHDARESYARDADDGELEAALDRLLALEYWPRGYDQSLRSLAALKNLTSQLIGRFCTAADRATRAVHGPGRLTRYAATLEIPRDVQLEVSILKALALRYVMRRLGAEALYQRQQVIVLELFNALVVNGPDVLEPWLRPWFASAPDDASRHRVLIDQIASLTDVSIVEWHARLVRGQRGATTATT